jgi:hypothetical protein
VSILTCIGVGKERIVREECTGESYKIWELGVRKWRIIKRKENNLHSNLSPLNNRTFVSSTRSNRKSLFANHGCKIHLMNSSPGLYDPRPDSLADSAANTNNALESETQAIRGAVRGLGFSGGGTRMQKSRTRRSRPPLVRRYAGCKGYMGRSVTSCPKLSFGWVQ